MRTADDCVHTQQPRYWPSLLRGWGWAAQQFVACGTLIPGGGKPIQWAPNAPAEATAVGRRCANGNGLRLTPGFAEGGRRGTMAPAAISSHAAARTRARLWLPPTKGVTDNW
jgi:hypothetical protein